MGVSATAFEAAVEAVTEMFQERLSEIVCETDGEEGGVGALFALFATRTPEGVELPKPDLVLLDMAGFPGGKDYVSFFVKKVAALSGSLAVLFASEVWAVETLPADINHPLVKQARELQQQGRLSEHPNAIEQLMLVAESHERKRMLMATITRHPSGSRTLGDWQEVPLEGAQGRFVGLLPPPDARLQTWMGKAQRD